MWRNSTSQLTVQVDEHEWDAIEEIKNFLGTKSAGAAVRIALAFAKHATRMSKNKTVIVKDQMSGKYVHLVLASQP